MKITNPALRWFFNMNQPVVLREDGTYTAPDYVGWHDLGRPLSILFLWGLDDHNDTHPWWKPEGGRTPDGTGRWFGWGPVTLGWAWYGWRAEYEEDLVDG